MDAVAINWAADLNLDGDLDFGEGPGDDVVGPDGPIDFTGTLVQASRHRELQHLRLRLGQARVHVQAGDRQHRRRRRRRLHALGCHPVRHYPRPARPRQRNDHDVRPGHPAGRPERRERRGGSVHRRAGQRRLQGRLGHARAGGRHAGCGLCGRHAQLARSDGDDQRRHARGHRRAHGHRDHADGRDQPCQRRVRRPTPARRRRADRGAGARLEHGDRPGRRQPGAGR